MSHLSTQSARKFSWLSFRTFSTAIGNLYNDIKETRKPKWIVKLDQAILRYPNTEDFLTLGVSHKALDLEIRAAGTGGHAVLGMNGTGKSLLSNALAYGSVEGPEDPHLSDVTTIHHNGIIHRPSVARVSFESHEALLQQGGSVYQALTPDGGVVSKAAQFLVVRFGLYSMLSRSVRTLSTGEIRKVLLIRALSRRPKLLILDNAFDGLDVPSRDTLKTLVSKTIAGFRSDVLVQGINAKATAHTQVVLMTHRASDIVDEISRVTFLSAFGQATTQNRNGRSGEELMSMMVQHSSDEN